jgi:tryptophan 2,3-dioxygenase
MSEDNMSDSVKKLKEQLHEAVASAKALEVVAKDKRKAAEAALQAAKEEEAAAKHTVVTAFMAVYEELQPGWRNAVRHSINMFDRRDAVPSDQ